MVPNPPERSDLGRLLAQSQLGLEMVAPIILGLVLDQYLNWTPPPWGVIGGAVLGLVIGLVHAVRLTNREDRPGSSPPGPGGETP
jgi:F0F1-type ATP synthase assembly protein I